jgi:hypothetical protein
LTPSRVRYPRLSHWARCGRPITFSGRKHCPRARGDTASCQPSGGAVPEPATQSCSLLSASGMPHTLQPLSYRTASFGVLVAPGAHERIADFMALGAPHVFVINPGAEKVDRWIFQVSKGPQRVEQIGTDTLHATIRAHHDDWGPASVLRAKSIGAHAAPVQLDFADYGLLPALEREAYQKLDQLFGCRTQYADGRWCGTHLRRRNSPASPVTTNGSAMEACG